MGYSNLEAKRRGEQALIEDNVFEERERLNKESQAFQQRQSSFDQDIDNATADGIRRGAISNETDMLKKFASQGMIDPRIAAQAEAKYQMFSAEDDMNQQQAGLGVAEETQDGAVEAQADDISTRLVQAYMQGAPDGEINNVIGELNVPDSVKSSAAQMFLSKRKDIDNQGGGMDQGPTDLLAQFKAKPTENTQRAFGIVAETDERMARLQQMLNPQPQEGQPQQ